MNEEGPLNLEALDGLSLAGQTRLLAVVVLIYALFSLPAFWLCGIIILKNANPLRAIAGFAGAWLLAALLAAFYIYVGQRHPEAAIGVAILGGLMVTWATSTFVSVIYKTKMIPALKMIISHFIMAACLALLATAILFVSEQTDALIQLKDWIEETPPEEKGSLT